MKHIVICDLIQREETEEEAPVKPERKSFDFYEKYRHKYLYSWPNERAYCIHTFKRDGIVYAKNCILCTAFNNQQKEIWADACHQEDLDKYEEEQKELRKKSAKNSLSVVKTEDGNLSLAKIIEVNNHTFRNLISKTEAENIGIMSLVVIIIFGCLLIVLG